MRPTFPDYLSRHQVVELLAEGMRWRVSYCHGAHQPNETGAGHPLPDGVLERVPTPAKVKKSKGRTFFYASLDEDDAGQLLVIEEP